MALALLLFGTPLAAHKASDAYLLLDAAPDRIALRVDVALRDVDAALGLDADGDGKLTWGEVRAAWPRIADWVAPRIGVAGCTLRADPEPSAPALERRSDGVYAVLRYAARCAVGPAPALRYALLAEVDPTHRGIARIHVAGAPVQVVVLDPTQPSPAAATASSSASQAQAAPDSVGAVSPSGGFLLAGVQHLLGGYDHVLFLICLLLPAVLHRRDGAWEPVPRLRDAVWPVAGIVTAFTVAHSITLTLAALRLVTLPVAFIESAIAVTIALAAFDNLRPWFPVPRVAVAFAFGLVHGFGFANVLGELELPPANLAWALFQFNLGLELGQLAVVAVVAPLLYAARRWRGYRPVVLAGGSAVALGIAAAWFVERVAGVRILPF